MTPSRHTPLAHLALSNPTRDDTGNAAAVLKNLPYTPCSILRGESDDLTLLEGFRKAMGFELPISPLGISERDGYSALWLGPSEWLIIGDKVSRRLNTSLAICQHALIGIGDAYQIIAVSGPRAIDVLTKHCPMDLNDLRLSHPWCSRTVLGGIQIVLRSLEVESYHVHVGRSLADYAWRLLEDAALEYSVVKTA